MNDQLVALWEDGLTVKEIAAKLEKHPGYVKQVLQDEGYYVDRRFSDLWKREKFHEIMESGATIAEAAETLGVSAATIQAELRRNNVKRIRSAHKLVPLSVEGN